MNRDDEVMDENRLYKVMSCVCVRAEKYSHISLSDNVVSHYLAIARKG